VTVPTRRYRVVELHRTIRHTRHQAHQRELDLQVTLGPAFIATSYAAPEVGETRPRLRRLTALTGYAVQPLFATMRSMERCGRRSNFKPLVFRPFPARVDRYFKRPHTQGYGKAVACLSESCPKIGTISKARFFPLAALVPSAGTKIFQIELYAVRHTHPCADPGARPLTKGGKPCKFRRN
jgi:hypothetical protein